MTTGESGQGGRADMRAAGIEFGQFRITPVSDGTLATNVEVVLGLDRPVAETLAGTDAAGRIVIPVTSFLVQGITGANVLIDAGSGTEMQSTLGRLPDQLRRLGVAPEAITHILLTHVHPDHANGLIDETGAAIFPNAELILSTDEADFWQQEPRGSEPPNLVRQRARNKRNLAPYLDRLRRVNDGGQALGFTAMLTPGHTPGHTCWRLDTPSGSLLSWGDIVHIASIQLERPDAGVTYDLDADRARAARARILDMAATDRLLIAGAHVTEPGLGAITRAGTGYRFEPIL
jgi:glyoxylase-like metal-dependent hydrolase (beta-lactamase superfamily II)